MSDYQPDGSFPIGLDMDESLDERDALLLSDTSPLPTYSRANGSWSNSLDNSVHSTGHLDRPRHVTIGQKGYVNHLANSTAHDSRRPRQAHMSRSSSMVNLTRLTRSSMVPTDEAWSDSYRPMGESASSIGLSTLAETARPMQRRPSQTYLRGGLSRSSSMVSMTSVDGSFRGDLGHNVMESSIHSMDISTHRPSYLLTEEPAGIASSSIGLSTLAETARPMQRRPSQTYLRGGLSRSSSMVSMTSVDGSFRGDLGHNVMESSIHSMDISTHRPSYLLSEEPAGIASRKHPKPPSRSSSFVGLPTLAEKGESHILKSRSKFTPPRESSAHNQANTIIETPVKLLNDSHKRKSSNSSIDQLKPSRVRSRRAKNSLNSSSSSLIKAVSMLSLKKKERSSENFNELVQRRKKENSSTNDGLPSYAFLEKDKKIDEGSLLPNAKWWHGIFIFSLIALVACIIRTWAPYPYGARMPTEMVAATDWSNGCIGLDSCICPRETICADDLTSMILLTIARCSAWFDYPLYMCLFLSKCNNLNNYLQKTALRCKINFSDFHKVHRLFGIIVGIESASHSLFHMLRWARRDDDIKLLWSSQTGISGLVCFIAGLFVILPMTSQYLRASMSFELRKG